jgi:hypothetical protein
VTVSAGDAVLGAVSVVNEDGTPVDGALSPDGLTWESAEPLGYKEYTLNAEALGSGGVTRNRMTFQTHSPETLTMPYVMPSNGEVVGVGQPIAVRFDENIPDRVAAQRAIKVTTTPPVQGAFYWLSDREVRCRPERYNTTKRGDIVEVVNTVGSKLPGIDGLGDWNIPWDQWRAGNAGI